MKRIIIGLIFITIGVLWGLQNYGIIDINWDWHIEWHKIILPAVFVFIGFNIFFGKSKNNANDLSDADYTE